jgi:Fic family protein
MFYLPHNARRMSKYIHLSKEWPAFNCEYGKIIFPLSAVRHKQGKLLGQLAGLEMSEHFTVLTLTSEAIASAELAGKELRKELVRQSIAQKLRPNFSAPGVGIEVEGMVEIILDSTQNFEQVLSEGRLCQWQADLSTDLPGTRKELWRNDADGPSRVVSNFKGKEHTHFIGPEASRLPDEVQKYLQWFNKSTIMDPVMKAAIAHLWFVTIRPFPDGNGRIARAITDMQLARAEGTKHRFYSMSAEIQKDSVRYYEILEETQRGDLDITPWLLWFIECLDISLSQAEEDLKVVIEKAKGLQHHAGVLNERQRKILKLMKENNSKDNSNKVTSSYWSRIGECSADTALRDIQDLIEKGILEKDSGGGRSTSYRLK